MVTKLSRKWLVKMSIFGLALILLGAWGLWDATVVYPRKGERHARFMLLAYLTTLDESGRLLREASVPDPAQALVDIERQDLHSGDVVAAARRAWLISLSRITSLSALTRENDQEMSLRAGDPAHVAQDTRTMFVDPSATLRGLSAELSNQSVPTPLNAYDIPFQWALLVLTWPGALLIGLVVLRARGRRFRYDRDTHTLTLPDGTSFAPDRIEVFDKRNWHKYYVHLRVNGIEGEIKLDLLRHEPLESWVLEMEKLHPNYEPPEEGEQAEEADTPARADASEPPG